MSCAVSLVVRNFVVCDDAGKKLRKTVVKIRGHMSMMHICNANGFSLPPLYVFSGEKLRHNMLDGAPEGMEQCTTMTCCACAHAMFDSTPTCTGSVMAFQKNGSFTGATFTDAMRHFVANTPAGKKLLIIDGHGSHHELEALDL